MRIAFLVGEFPALSETFILNQITGLIDLNHEIDIFAYGPRDERKVHPDIQKYNLNNKCYYHDIPKNKFFRLIKAFYLLLSNLHRNPKGLFSTLNFIKYGKQVFSLVPFYSAISFLKHNNYDTILCHFGPIGNLGAILKDSGIINGKLLTVFHGNDISEYIRRNGESAYDFLFKTGDLFLPISDYWRNKLIDLGCNEEKLIVHRMGVDIDKFELSRIKRDNSKIKILSTARLVEKKGIEYGVRAVIKVLKRESNIEYNIIGNGPLKSELEAIITKHNVAHKIKFLGWKEQEELKKLLENTDILLAPSITSKSGDMEGIPVVLMEAMAMGIPVVSTKHSAIPELVKDGVCGFLVEEKDVNALSDSLFELISNKKLRVSYGLNGRKQVENEYNIKKLNSELIRILEKKVKGEML